MRNILKNTRPEKYFPRASPLSLSHYTPVTLINLRMILQNIYNNLNILLFDNLLIYIMNLKMNVLRYVALLYTAATTQQQL